MALGDYILCCKCEVKLIYDGDRGQREWWEERFGKPPEIECPDCKAPASKPLSDEQRRETINRAWNDYLRGEGDDSFSWYLSQAIEADHGIKGDA